MRTLTTTNVLLARKTINITIPTPSPPHGNTNQQVIIVTALLFVVLLRLGWAGLGLAELKLVGLVSGVLQFDRLGSVFGKRVVFRQNCISKVLPTRGYASSTPTPVHVGANAQCGTIRYSINVIVAIHGHAGRGWI